MILHLVNALSLTGAIPSWPGWSSSLSSSWPLSASWIHRRRVLGLTCHRRAWALVPCLDAPSSNLHFSRLQLECLSAVSALAWHALAGHVLITATVWAFRLALPLSVYIRYELLDLGYGILLASLGPVELLVDRSSDFSNFSLAPVARLVVSARWRCSSNIYSNVYAQMPFHGKFSRYPAISAVFFFSRHGTCTTVCPYNQPWREFSFHGRTPNSKFSFNLSQRGLKFCI